MGKTKARYKPESFETTRSGDHFTRFYDSMLVSGAYKSLSHAARTVYTILKLQYRGNYTGGTVICPYRTLQEYGMNTRTIRRALSELENKGFIEISHGTRQADNCNIHRQPNEYTFSEKWKAYTPLDSL